MQDPAVKTQKITVLGEGAVGKSSITLQFVSSVFHPQHDPTIDSSYRKQTVVDGSVRTLEILDTAGQEEYRMMRALHIRQGEGFMIVFSVTDRRSFEEVPRTYEEILRITEGVRPRVLLVANKIDLAEERQVFREESAEMAARLGAPLLETSARVGTNVHECFATVSRMIAEGWGNKEGGGGKKSGERKEDSGGRCRCALM